MFVSPGYALQLKISGASEHRASKSVQSGEFASTPGAGGAKSQAAGFTPSINNVEYDSEAMRVIVRQIHASSGTVLSQYPNEAQLRIRDYVAVPEATKGKVFSEEV